VTTGYGSAVRTGETRAGDTVVVMGVGGVGVNAVQGARIAGARNIVAIDPVEFKRDRSRGFGATHVAATVNEAWPLVNELTRGEMANVCVITTDVAEGAYVTEHGRLRGSLFGSSKPRSDIPQLWSLYDSGQLKLDELVTREYALEDINTGYSDMLNGLNLRGLIRY
jgi:Zn-dependent alcohol dehydrogenase